MSDTFESTNHLIQSTDALEKGRASSGISAVAAGGIIKLAAGVADMKPKIRSRQMSTASFDISSMGYEQVNSL